MSSSLALTGLTPHSAAADSSAPSAYRQAIMDTYDLIRGAAPDDTATARQAVTVLRAGTGSTQPEILADLQRQPPAFDDAKVRLLALLAAVDQPANTTDPQLAQERLHDVLAMHRYDALRRAPSLLDRFLQWAGDRVRQLLSLLFGVAGARAPMSVFYLLGGLVLATIVVIVFSSARGRFRQSISANQPSGPRAPADYFSEADSLAARGDRVGAIRALCAGVAATLAGEQTWEGSPLTVREIFHGSADPARLDALLRPFEAAVYGGRAVDTSTYERAAQVAAPFRRPVAVAA